MGAWAVAAAAFFFACFVFSIFYNIGSSDSKEECKTNYPELIETQAECKTNHPGLIETQAECSSKYPTTCSSTGSTRAECKTNHPGLIEHSECGDESVGPDTTNVDLCVGTLVTDANCNANTPPGGWTPDTCSQKYLRVSIPGDTSMTLPPLNLAYQCTLGNSNCNSWNDGEQPTFCRIPQ